MFCKPDKGNGVIVLDRSDYNNKMYNVIHDQLKFKPLSEDPTEKREVSLQRYLRLLYNKGIFSEGSYRKIRPCGSNPSRIYGLPKMHKPDVPLRPIVSAIGSYTYNLAKFMSEILKPLSHSQYDIKDSFAFSSELLSVTSIPYMCSQSFHKYTYK